MDNRLVSQNMNTEVQAGTIFKTIGFQLFEDDISYESTITIKK